MAPDTSTLNLVSRLRRLNVKLFTVDGQLRCSAPAGVLTPALRDELAARKSEVLSFLGTASLSSLSDPIEVISRHGDTAFPLSSAQRRLWLLSQLDPVNFAYNIPASFRLHGHLDIDALERSLSEIIRRHEVLRTRFLSVDGQPVVKIVPPQPVRVALFDLQSLEPTEQNAESERLSNADATGLFRLDRDPLLRASLLKFGPENHLLLVTVAHIAFDGCSLGILVKELSRLYTACVSSEALPLPELQIQYVDFAAWQQKVLETEAFQSQIDYWKEKLRGSLPVLELPIDHPRPPAQRPHGGSVFFQIPRTVTDELKVISEREGATLFVTLLAVFSTVLLRYSGQEEILVGTPVANRTRTEVENLIGLFLNTLVMRADLSGNPTCRELIGRIRDTALGAYAHQDVPFEKLVEVLNPPRDASRSPIFQTMFSLERSPVTALELRELAPAWPGIRNTGAQFDLSLYLTETENSITGRFSFASDLFEHATVARMKDHFMNLLFQFIRDPEQRIHEVPLFSEVERDGILALWSRKQNPYPSDACVHELVRAHAGRLPDAIALECGSERLTYRELDQRSDQFAAYLQSHGVRPGTLVGICVERSVGMAVALLAILKTGAAYVPLDPAFPVDRLVSVLEDAAPSILITEGDGIPALAARDTITVCLDRFQWNAEVTAYQPPDSFDRAYVLYTSGSSGKPKGVEVSHRSLVNLLCSMRAIVGMGESDVLLSVTTFSFDIFGLELWLPLTTGSKTVIATKETCKDGRLLARAIATSDATMMQATPNTWQMLLESEWQGSLRMTILCGGEHWSRELALRLLPKCSALWNMYGPTETTIWSSAHRIEADGSVKIGGPIANTQFYVVNPYLQLQPPSVPGELLIGGDGVARGYLNRPELTRERFIANPFTGDPADRVYRTGDLVRTSPEGTIEFISRLDDQVKLRGFRIELGEIEAALRRSAALQEVIVVLTKEDEPRLVAYCIPSRDTNVSASELRTLLKGMLPEYMIPADFAFVESFPITPNGKVDRRALASLPRAPRERHSEQDEPRDDLERKLIPVWERVLRVRPIYPSDNFFDLGGHSFTAVRILAEIQKLTGKRLPLAVLFRASTIRSLAEILGSESGSSWSSMVPIRPEGSKPPLFLVHGAEGNVLLYRQLVQYLEHDQPVYGLQSQGLSGEEPISDSIEEMAAKYVDEIIATQPSDPYIVGGYCLGGLIALEIAQQLTAAGRKVAQVLMFETYYAKPNGTRTFRGFELLYGAQNVWFHAANFAAIQGSERRGFLSEKLDVASSRFRLRLGTLRDRFFRKSANTTLRHYPHLLIKKSNDEAASRYVPAPYNGRVAVIRPKRYFAGLDSRSFGWGELLGPGLEVHEIPIYPKGMLVEPFCRDLANIVTQCLREASSSRPTTETKTMHMAADVAERAIH
jgi:amino acid adenylation domain-containing protein